MVKLLKVTEIKSGLPLNFAPSTMPGCFYWNMWKNPKTVWVQVLSLAP